VGARVISSTGGTFEFCQAHDYDTAKSYHEIANSRPISSVVSKEAERLVYILVSLLFPQWLVKRPNVWYIFWSVCTPLVFLVDHRLHAVLQLLPALVIWWLLVVALLARVRHEQLLLAVLVVVATASEVVASLVLHWYSYRLYNIPPWVPPGHGIVFLTAILGMEQQWAIKYAALLRNLVTFGALAYACLGVVSQHHDFTGAAFAALFLIWLWTTGSEKARFYTILWVWVCFLELSGVWLGAWHWSSSMPLTGLSEGNPPSGIVGAYGIFDLVAFEVTAAITRQAQTKVRLLKWLRITCWLRSKKISPDQL
jgi:hypothetical protein